MQQELGIKQGIAECLAALAATVDAGGQSERATQVFAASSTLLAAIGVPLAPADQVTLSRELTAARTKLGAAAWAAEWAVGSTLSTDEAIRLALMDDLDRISPTATRADSDTDPDLHRLSKREREVCQLLGRGLSNREIAAELSISEKTVGSHIDHIMTKLGLRSRTRIALWAVEHGLVRSGE
jgi:non-specific serine/threonine protein kinase